MVFTQALGAASANKLKKPNGKKAVRGEIKANIDIKKTIDATLRGNKSKTNKQRDLARQKAIVKVGNRNPAFRSAVRSALILALRNQ